MTSDSDNLEKSNSVLRSIFEKSCKAEKLNELLKDGSDNFRKPYGPRPTSEYVDYIDQPSGKGRDD